MTIYAYKLGDQWAQAYGSFTPEEAAAARYVEVVEDPTPDGVYWVTSTWLYDVDGAPHLGKAGDPWSMATAKAIRQGEAQTQFNLLLERGFPCTLQGVPETLQVRNADDKVNWTRVLIRAQWAKDSGAGDQPIGLPIRCTSNRMYSVTNSEAVDLMNAGEVWMAEMMGRNWQLQGEIDALDDGLDSVAGPAALSAVDVTSGWPTGA